MSSSNTVEIIRPRRAPNIGGMQVVIRHTDGETFTYAGLGRSAYRHAIMTHRRAYPNAVIEYAGARIISGYLTA